MAKTLVKNTFSIEMQESFVGYYDPGRNWNGWDCPYFEWDEALKITKWLNERTDEKQLEADSEKKVIIFYEDPDEPFEIEGAPMETEDGIKTLYSIGTGWWIWEAVDKNNGQ